MSVHTLRTLLVVALVFSSFQSLRARRLKGLKISCCDDGFKLDSSFLVVGVKEGDVTVDSPLGDITYTDEGAFIDSSLLGGSVKVEVAGGEIMSITSDEDGTVDLTVGKDGAFATVFVGADGSSSATVGKEEIVVDFSDEDGGITVKVGENGKIVDVETDEEGNGKVKVGEDGKVARLNVSGGDVELSLFEGDEEGEEVTADVFGDGEDGGVLVTGTDVVNTDVGDG